MMPLVLHQIAFLILLAAACAYAGVRGGPPERITAVAILTAAVLTGTIGRMGWHHRYYSVPIDVLTVDLALFAILWLVAMRSARFWPIAMASMQGAGLLGHLARPLSADIVPPAYYALVAFWGFPIVILLAVATHRHRRRLARYGVDHAWASQLPATYRAGGHVHER